MNKVFVDNVCSKLFSELTQSKLICIPQSYYCFKTKDSIDYSKLNIPKGSFKYPKPKHAVIENHKSPIQIWREELTHYYDYIRHPSLDKPFLRRPLPLEFDFIIIGGGIIGSSIAFWLRKVARAGATLLVIDKDLSHTKSSVPLSAGCITHQFSLPENIKLSVFGSEFIRNIDRYTQASRFTRPCDISFKPFGYLTLASEKMTDLLRENHKNQLKEGAHSEILTPFQLKQRYPWLNTDGISLACHGLQDEGWFDPWALLMNIRASAMRYGAVFTEAEPIEFIYDLEEEMTLDGFGRFDYRPTNHLIIRSKEDGFLRKIQFAYCFVAAGADTGKVTKELLHIDRRNPGLFSLEVPIERRKRYVYYFEAREFGFGLSSPMIVDPSGLYVRREGTTNHYICSLTPLPEEEPPTDNLDVDYDFFYNRVWPILSHRIPAFKEINLKHAWAGFYDYNYFDQNGILGRHPAYHNISIAAGFSGRGLQHGTGIGRAVMEEVVHGTYTTIDLQRFSFGRIAMDEPLIEFNCI